MCASCSNQWLEQKLLAMAQKCKQLQQPMPMQEGSRVAQQAALSVKHVTSPSKVCMTGERVCFLLDSWMQTHAHYTDEERLCLNSEVASHSLSCSDCDYQCTLATCHDCCLVLNWTVSLSMCILSSVCGNNYLVDVVCSLFIVCCSSASYLAGHVLQSTSTQNTTGQWVSILRLCG